MDLITLTALYPVAKELVERSTPQVRKWLEKKAKQEDPFLFLHLHLMESMQELRDGIRELRDGIHGLRSYILTTSIMSAMLSNPNLTEDEIREEFIKSVEVAKNISNAIKGIAP